MKFGSRILTSGYTLKVVRFATLIFHLPYGGKAVTGKLIVLCTCGSAEEARKIAHGVVEKQLAACVNILPGVESIYRWQGAVEQANEVMLIMKTRDTVYANLEAEIRRLHSYSVPEIIAVPVERGLRAYLDWVGSETQQIQ